MSAPLREIADRVLAGRGMAHKTDIAGVVAALGIDEEAIRVGDDCAAIPDGDGWLLFAIEGFVNDFVEADPRFAGYCGVDGQSLRHRRDGRPTACRRRCDLGA